MTGSANFKGIREYTHLKGAKCKLRSLRTCFTVPRKFEDFSMNPLDFVILSYCSFWLEDTSLVVAMLLPVHSLYSLISKQYKYMVLKFYNQIIISPY